MRLTFSKAPAKKIFNPIYSLALLFSTTRTEQIAKQQEKPRESHRKCLGLSITEYSFPPKRF